MNLVKEHIVQSNTQTWPIRSDGTYPASDLLTVGVIGYGYWGPKLVRNFQEIPQTRVTMVADVEPKRLARARRAHPDLTTTTDYRDMLAPQRGVDAVVVATPVSTHFSIARDALLYDKHVLVEKPLARTCKEGKTLIDLAAQRDRTLMVGHTFEYNPAVEKLKEIIASGELGRILYVNSTRANLGIFQPDINVMWDLAPHDISILLYLLERDPISVSAVGQAYVQTGIHDVVRLTLNFPEKIQAHIHVSWLDPCKVRRMTIVGDKKMIVYDDVETREKLKVYDKRVETPTYTNNYGEFQLSYRYGNITIPRISLDEPLKVESIHFADCVLHGRRPRSDGQVGLKVIKVLESADKSLQNEGVLQPIVW